MKFNTTKISEITIIVKTWSITDRGELLYNYEYYIIYHVVTK